MIDKLGTREDGFAMKKIAPLLLVVFLAGFSGCTATVPKTPKQIVFDAEAAYAASLVLETKYVQLPRCTNPGAPPVCSDPATVKKIKGISDATWTSLQAAEKTVRTPGFGDSVLESAAIAARNASDAYTAITKPLPR